MPVSVMPTFTLLILTLNFTHNMLQYNIIMSTDQCFSHLEHPADLDLLPRERLAKCINNEL